MKSERRIKKRETMKISGEEYLRIVTTAKPFWENGKAADPPEFVVIMGNVGAGKTTLRRKLFGTGYVNFDFGEIVNALKREFGAENAKVADYALVAGSMILDETLRDKRNVVIEIIGDDEGLIRPVVDGMKNLGYAFSLEFASCDPEKAYKRHLKAAEEDEDYVSAYFTEEPTLSFFYQRLDLGKMPVSTRR